MDVLFKIAEEYDREYFAIDFYPVYIIFQIQMEVKKYPFYTNIYK